MEQLKKFAAFIAAEKKRFAILAVGFLGNKAIVWIVNYGIDPFLIYNYGLIKGGIASMVFSFFICLATIVFYDWAKTDWLGIEMVKEMKEYEGQKQVGRAIRWLLLKGDFIALIGLSILTDPFITLVYLRKGANQYNGMNLRDWKIFLASTFISNLWWVLLVFGGIQIIRSFLFGGI